MIVDYKELNDLTQTWGSKKVGLVTGCFDILHLGHVSLFEFAKNHVDMLIVGVDSDRSVKINKGSNRPIYDQDSRLQVVDGMRFVDFSFIIDHGLDFFNPNTLDFFTSLYKTLKVTHLISDINTDSTYKRKQSIADEIGIELILRDDKRFVEFSSTKKIKELDI